MILFLIFMFFLSFISPLRLRKKVKGMFMILSLNNHEKYPLLTALISPQEQSLKTNCLSILSANTNVKLVRWCIPSNGITNV